MALTKVDKIRQELLAEGLSHHLINEFCYYASEYIGMRNLLLMWSEEWDTEEREEAMKEALNLLEDIKNAEKGKH